MEHQIKEWVSPFLDKPLDEHAIPCPLHFFALGRFKQVLFENGYEIAHPEGIFFNRKSKDLIYAETGDMPYRLNFITTLSYRSLEELYSKALRDVYKNKYVLIGGRDACSIRDSLNAPDFDGIKHTISQSVTGVLENSLWSFEDFCGRFSKHNLSSTLGILLYGSPGVGKTFILRSYFNKLLLERKFTVVQVYQECLSFLNLSALLNSCQALFPCILFLEDIDVGFRDRRDPNSSLAKFLLETFEGLLQVQKVALVATTNNVDVIEKALLRPGRIDYLMEVKKPSKSAKELVLSQYLDGSDLDLLPPLKETLINSADTFAELKGALQHMLRTYVSTGDFPPVEEVARMISIWKEARVEGISEKRERKLLQYPVKFSFLRYVITAILGILPGY